MGNQGSSFGNSSIFIQTDQAFYIAGDTVTGKAHVNMLEAYPANMIHIKVKGYEESFWEERLSRDVKTGQGEQTRQEYYFVPHKGKNTFYNHKFPLYAWSGCSFMPPGQYTFPFQFKLMDTLPGSYFEEGKHNGGVYKAVIKYKVKAEIESGHHKTLKTKQELTVREPLKNAVTTQFGERTVKPNTWCCISQGTSHIKCYFERNSYLPGETAKMMADLDNAECDLDIKNLNCSFIKCLRLFSSNGRELIIQHPVQARQFAGVNAHQQAIGADRRFVEISLNSSNGQAIQPSTKGRLVQCEYTIRVHAALSGCVCCTAQPEVTVPIAILSPPPVNYGVVSAPPGWNPQIFEVKNIAFSSECMYTKSLPLPNVNIQIPQPNMNMGMNINMNMSNPPQQQNYPPQQQNYPPQQQNYPPPQQNYPPPQQNYPPPPQQNQQNFPPPMGMNVNFGMAPPPPPYQQENYPPPQMNVSIGFNNNTSQEFMNR